MEFGQHEIAEWVAETSLGSTYKITRLDNGKFRLRRGNSSIATRDDFDKVVDVARWDYVAHTREQVDQRKGAK